MSLTESVFHETALTRGIKREEAFLEDRTDAFPANVEAVDGEQGERRPSETSLRGRWTRGERVR